MFSEGSGISSYATVFGIRIFHPTSKEITNIYTIPIDTYNKNILTKKKRTKMYKIITSLICKDFSS